MKKEIKELFVRMDDAEVVEFLEERFKHFVDYFNNVYEMVISAEANRRFLDMGKISIEEYQDRMMRLDSSRRSAHEVAIAACAQINRQCDRVNLPHICPDTTDRYVIADFIGTFVYNIYEEEITKVISMDQAIDAARKNGSTYSAAEIEKVKEEDYELAR